MCLDNTLTGMVHRRAKKVRAPPGLELPTEDPKDMFAVESTCIVDLSRRVQRLELLLFRAGESDFAKLDAQIIKLLDGSLDDAGDTLEAMQPEDFPMNCEFFDMSEECGPSLGVSSQTVHFEVEAAQAKVEALSVAVESLQDQMTQLQGSFHEMQASRANLVNEVVCGVQGLITSKVGALEGTVASLSDVAEAHTTQINKVIDKNERLFQILESTVVGGQAIAQPAVPQKSCRGQARPRK